MNTITMSTIAWSFFLLAQAIACAALSSNLADKKGYSTGAWFAAGFFLGIFGLIAAAGLPSSRLQAERNSRELDKQTRRQIVEEASRATERKRTTTVADLLDG